jgi:catechol 2,3-dioxygenase-like lactoylglutathione lyase family enzyme
MFERFTDGARETVVRASEVARGRGDRSIEAVHMLAGLAAAEEPTVSAAGLTRDRIERLWDEVIATTATSDGIDAEALAGIGIDADAVRYAADRHFGRGALGRARRRQLCASTGHLPFSPTLKKALELSLTHAESSRSRDLTPTHLLLGLLDIDDADLLAVLRAAQVTPERLRTTAVESLGVQAAPRQPEPAPVRAGLDHVALQVADLDSAATFYGAALAPLGVRELMRHDDVVGFGGDRPFFWLGKATAGGPAREVHLAFTAPDRKTVYDFRDAAVTAGAEVLHEPRIFREYHPSYFAAFVRDPDGNNVEAVCHVPAPA